MKNLISIFSLVALGAMGAEFNSSSFINGNFVFGSLSNVTTALTYSGQNIQYVNKTGKRVKSGTASLYSGTYSLLPGSNGVQVSSWQNWFGAAYTNTWLVNTNPGVAGASNTFGNAFIDVPAIAHSDGAISSNAVIQIVCSSGDNTNQIDFAFGRVFPNGFVDPVAVQTCSMNIRAANSNATTTFAVSPYLMQGAQKIRLLSITPVVKWTNFNLLECNLNVWKP